jgi:drug/metabolite transporter (DMT)-like permease
MGLKINRFMSYINNLLEYKNHLKSQHTLGIMLLVAVTIFWGTTFPLVKQTIVSLSPGTLIAIRCALAALAFAVHLRHLNMRSLRDGSILGLLLFASLATQGIALETISANRSAFIASMNVILVPLLGQLLGQRVLLTTLLAAGLALGGVGVMSWEDGVLSVGDLWMVGDVLCYAAYIMILEAVTPHHPPLSLTAVQISVIGVLAALWSAPELIGEIEVLTKDLTNFIPIVYLALVTAATTWLPAIAQNSVSAQETAIIYTFEPAVAAVFSFWLLGEKLGVRGWLGAGMVLAAMILSQIPISNFLIKILPLSPEQAKNQEQVSELDQKLEPMKEKLPEERICEGSLK